MKLKIVGVVVLICSIQSAVAAATDEHFPCLIVENGGSDSYIVDDPNWDDQQLVVNGRRLHKLHARLKPHDAIKICGLYAEFGIIFEDNHQNYLSSAEIANDGDARLTEVELYPKYKLQYELLSQSYDMMSIKLIN